MQNNRVYDKCQSKYFNRQHDVQLPAVWRLVHTKSLTLSLMGNYS